MSGQSQFRSLYTKDDWWAVWIGLAILVLSVPSFTGVLPLGWVPVATSWTNVSAALSTKWGNPWAGLLALYLFILLVLSPFMKIAGLRLLDWVKGFTAIFAIGWVVWIGANYAPIVAAMGSSEVGYIFALIVGIAIANFAKEPGWLKGSAKGDFFIKVAIVLLGAKILLTTFATTALPILGAVFLSFPVVWLVGFFASKRAGLDRNLSATLSSGVGVCGVSASIATASAIEAPPLYATMMSSIIILFSAVEIVVMPAVSAFFFGNNPTAAGVWMGLSVKTDGAASASGSVVDGLLKANGSALSAAVSTKVMIDIWIGLIAFILSSVWIARGYLKPSQGGQEHGARLIWYKFPKFVLGYFATSIVVSLIAFGYPTVAQGAKAVAPITSAGTDPFRVAFFIFTFLAIGLNTRFSDFRQVGIGKPALVYALCLCFAIAWGGIVSYMVFG